MRRRVSGGTWVLAGLAGLGAFPAAQAAAYKTPPPTAHSTSEGTELLGRPAPPFEVSDWLQSPPLTLDGLKGKVVLVRWFTSAGCPFCSASAPTLNELHADYAGRGLVVIGMYHHKDDTPLDVDAVRGSVHDYGFKFPVAIDRDWKTLHRWWLDGHHRDFTSVTFLLDKAGIIRRIHRGGAFVRDSRDYGEMKAAIDRLLAAP